MLLTTYWRVRSTFGKILVHQEKLWRRAPQTRHNGRWEFAPPKVVNNEILIVERSLVCRNFRLYAGAKEYFVVYHSFFKGHSVQSFP